MRPIHLELQGFTAFRQFTELNFDDLELFAIVGSTGSGKSSLLDAMTFALYGSTERLGASGLDALITTGERGLSVSLTFEAGGQVYRAARTKGRKQAENDVRLERQDEDGRWTGLNDGGKRGIDERIRQAVGLDAKTFARSVMLPQGEFARLLHGSSKERQNMLGELTGLHHVQAMQKVASDQAKELKYRADSDQKVLANEYEGVTAEAVAALHAERERLSAEAERLTDTLENLRARQTRLRDTERVWLAREDTRRRLTTLQARTGSILDGAQRAAQARRVAGVEPLLDAAQRARIAHEREAATLARAATQAEVVARAVQTAQTALDAAQKAENTIPELEARAEALREAEADAARLRRAGGTVQTTHPAPLLWDEDAHHAARESAQKLEKLKGERVQIEAQKAALHADRERQNTETAQLKKLTDEQERVMREGQEAKTASERADAALKTAQIEAGAAAYRTHLHAGEPCPLCLQQVEHVPPASNLDLGKLEQEASALKTNLEGRRLRYKEIGLELATLRKSVDARTDALRDWEAQIGQRELDLRELESHITGDPQTEALRLLAGLAARVREAGADPAKLRKQALDGVAAIRKRVQDAAAALARAQSDDAGAQATLQSAQAAATTRAREQSDAGAALNAALTVLGLDAAQARAAALPEADIAALEEAARTHTAQVSQLAENLKELERQLGVAPFDPAELGQVTRDLTATDAALTAARELAGQLREQQRTAQERLERKAEIERRAALLAAQHDTWKMLTNSLRADEFQQFLLAEVEAQLLTRAGILLHSISDGRYRLALADGEYVVQDLWNAGEARGVKTLSGGETFLASLSLAIALSDYLAGNKILGALFLDEGFGTLDPQALEAVAGALENLRTQGRMVGVVTHVESLSERLPSRLLVTKSVAGSSVQRF
ncbi:AAA family ATPase [Deinococcus sp. QL22]|uniref:AAA family ATPase n=1 Tax=Deinococcus sp. QL22 TaxID=2939437 RepID=UPI002016DE5E|nr:SMC family ATPase [Deinococcus sp. QL22]UQN05544.1 SMC family ATPase [Deinococcus sp. QL22]